MQLRLLDILADPDDPSRWPLDIHVITQETRERTTELIPHKSTGLLCKFYCARKKEFLVSDPLGDNEKTLSSTELNEIVTFDECKTCVEDEIIDAIIFYDVNGTKKWFLVDREIAVMYPLNLRDPKQEKAFFNRHKGIFENLNLSYDIVRETKDE